MYVFSFILYLHVNCRLILCLRVYYRGSSSLSCNGLGSAKVIQRMVNIVGGKGNRTKNNINEGTKCDIISK